MNDWVTDMPKNQDLSTYTHGPNSGNGLVDILTAILSKGNFLQAPGHKQDVYDAFLQQSRSRDFMRIKQGDAFGANQMFQFFGMNPNSTMMRHAGMAFGDPNGPAMRMLSPLIGGNPVAAQMQMYAGFTGMTTGAFGNAGNMSLMQSDIARQSLTSSFYQQKQFDYEGSMRDLNRRGDEMIKRNPTLASKYGFKPGDRIDFSRIDSGATDPNTLGALNEGLSDMNAIANSSDPEVKKRKDDLILSRQKRLEAETKAIDRALWKKHTDKNGVVNIAGVISDLGAHDLFQQLNQERLGNEQMKNTFVAGHINYGLTRGFALEDFTSAAVAGADLRLIGGRPDQMASSAAQFLKNGGGGTLSAARSVFGDKGGGELMRDISGLLGTGSADMLSKAGNAEVEGMLRDMKSASRMAGTSIDTVLGIINEAKVLAQSRPELRYISGQTVTAMTLKSLGTAQQMNSVMSSEAVRRAGGPMGVTTGLISERTSLADSDISKGTAALHFNFQGNADAQKLISDYASGKHGAITPGSLPGMIKKLSAMTGKSEAELHHVFQSELSRSLAMGDKGSAAIGEEVSQNALYDNIMGSITSDQAHALGREIAKQGPGKLDFAAAFSRIGASNKAQSMVAKYSQTMTHQYLMRSDPQYAASVAASDAERSRMSQQSKEFDEKYGYLYASKTQQAFQSLVGGDMSKGAVDDIFNIFAGTKGFKPEDMERQKSAFMAFGEANKTYAANRGLDAEGARKQLNASGAAFVNELNGTDFNGDDISNATRYLQNNASLNSGSDAASAIATLSKGDAKQQRMARVLQAMGAGGDGFGDLKKHGVQGLAASMSKDKLKGVVDSVFDPEEAKLTATLAQNVGGIGGTLGTKLEKMYGTDIKGMYRDLASGKSIDDIAKGKGVDLTPEEKANLAVKTQGVQNSAVELEARKKAALGKGDSAKTAADMPGMLQKILDSLSKDLPKSIDALTDVFRTLTGTTGP